MLVYLILPRLLRAASQRHVKVGTSDNTDGFDFALKSAAPMLAVSLSDCQ